MFYKFVSEVTVIIYLLCKFRLSNNEGDSKFKKTFGFNLLFLSVWNWNTVKNKKKIVMLLYTCNVQMMITEN